MGDRLVVRFSDVLDVLGYLVNRGANSSAKNWRLLFWNKCSAPILMSGPRDVQETPAERTETLILVSRLSCRRNKITRLPH